MKDVLLVNMFSKNESSYTEYYIDELRKAGLSYESIYFERYNMDAEAGDNELLFKEYCPTGGNKLKKVGTMGRFASFVRKTIKEGQYRGIMVFTTVPAIMIQDLLSSKFNKRYIFDIRDYTHESNPVYFRMVRNLIRQSFATVISSRGFLRFLPENERYYVTHNIAMENPENYQAKAIDPLNIRIGFVGSIRYFDENSKLIRQFSNQENCQLDYYGTFSQGCDLPSVCEQEKITNVHFHGRFNNSEKKTIYQNIDIINSIYGVKGLETTTAVPNRLYDAAIYKCPIIVSKNTYLADLVEQYGLGFAVDVHNENVLERLNSYLSEFDKDVFAENCSRFLKDVYSDMAEQKRMINVFIEKMKQSV